MPFVLVLISVVLRFMSSFPGILLAQIDDVDVVVADTMIALSAVSQVLFMRLTFALLDGRLAPCKWVRS